MFLLSQNFVIIIFCIGKLTRRSFMFNVIILCCSLIWTLLSSHATSLEFLVAYVYGKFINWLSLLLRCLASFYDGDCLLFITSLINLSCTKR